MLFWRVIDRDGIEQNLNVEHIEGISMLCPEDDDSAVVVSLGGGEAVYVPSHPMNRYRVDILIQKAEAPERDYLEDRKKLDKGKRNPHEPTLFEALRKGIKELDIQKDRDYKNLLAEITEMKLHLGLIKDGREVKDEGGQGEA